MAEFKKLQEDITILLDRTKDIPTINATISNISNKLDNLEVKFKGEINRIEKKLIEVEKSQDFISKEYEKYRHISNNITTKNGLIENENIALKGQLDRIQHDLEQKKAARNEDAQYHRSSLNVKLTGIPLQQGEEKIKQASNNISTLEVIKNLAEEANISEFHPQQIDVCHRIGKTKYSPIIIRFKNKCDRQAFYSQKNKLRPIKDPRSFANLPLVEDSRTNDTYTPHIQMQESLTNYNAELLKLAREAALNKQYIFHGYIINGQVCVKKDKDSIYIPIRCKSDINKIS